MERRIIGYGQDEAGEPIALLECGHPQHIRHQPPFINRPWTLTREGREAMLGQALNCVRCESPWSRLALGDALTADPQLAEIEARFARAYAEAGRPAEMAVFKRHDTEHSLHCVVTVYFSPAAWAIASASGATACPAPSRANLDLLAGDPGCWSTLFEAQP